MIKNVLLVFAIMFLFLACSYKDKSSYNKKAAQYQQEKAQKAYKELE